MILHLQLRQLIEKLFVGNPQQAEEAWEKWFVPFFKTIENNKDIVKATSYINFHWKANEMRFDNPTFQDVDACLQTSKIVSERWEEKIYSYDFIIASDDFFDLPWGE